MISLGALSVSVLQRTGRRYKKNFFMSTGSILFIDIC
jgi:hypothetical protein